MSAIKRITQIALLGMLYGGGAAAQPGSWVEVRYGIGAGTVPDGTVFYSGDQYGFSLMPPLHYVYGGGIRQFQFSIADMPVPVSHVTLPPDTYCICVTLGSSNLNLYHRFDLADNNATFSPAALLGALGRPEGLSISGVSEGANGGYSSSDGYGVLTGVVSAFEAELNDAGDVRITRFDADFRLQRYALGLPQLLSLDGAIVPPPPPEALNWTEYSVRYSAITAVPEPSEWMLWMAGLGILLVRRMKTH